MKISVKDIEIKLFKYQWIIIILPKVIQFFIYLFVMVYLGLNKKIKLDDISKLLIGGIFVQLLAVIIQILFYQPDISRIFASINTMMIWLIAIFFYNVARNKAYDVKYISRLERYVSINIIILFIIYLASLVVKNNYYTIGGLQFAFRRVDYLASGTTTRFCGLMETVLGPSHMLMFSCPVLLFSKYFTHNSKIRVGLLLLLTYITVFASHSRIGTVIGFITVVFAILSMMIESNISKKWIVIFVAGTIGIAGLFIVLKSRELVSLIYDFFYSRGGSNDARFAIYKNSIEKTINESPIVGIGIKYMLGDFPYGSHCTYIGLFYKTGIIGSLLFMCAFFKIIKKLYKKYKIYSHTLLLFMSIMMYFGLLIFSDLDASNWVIVSVFFVWGLLLNKNFSLVEREG